ncbi:NUDIX hydrolase [Mastigocoleus testarum]|uniref:NUDIX hydrolase n=1 Tax=Mastigocoleus testarum BC008 TaxID=371196 RepID=A0A0V7ZDK1_9CYAN|nr:NUDIX hydrolase [Mastigocoleus testarum]KST62640.1 NUDIX hydrolase [Mastigocoleus testarum BC008]
MTNLKKWELLESNMVLDHPYCQVRRDEIRLPNGKVIDDFFVHVKPDVALVLAVTPKREVVFVRQYRHAIGEFFIELPAGGFDPTQEAPEIAAMREMEEETGYSVKNLQKIATLYDRPSKDTNQTHVFFAENAIIPEGLCGANATGKQNLDPTEEIEVLLIPVDSILEKINSGKISVMGTVTALLLGLKFLS